MALESSGLSVISSIGVPATRKDVARVPPPTPDKPSSQATAELVVLRQGSEPVFKQAEAFRETTDKISAGGLKERVAIEAYQSIAKEQQRQDIQQLLGVDTFV
ncbi:MAG: hypothetical protein NWQ54_17005 [Paraglaciecola sp.]|nr:hypothetical protein [Paraglaciecola sp.]